MQFLFLAPPSTKISPYMRALVLNRSLSVATCSDAKATPWQILVPVPNEAPVSSFRTGACANSDWKVHRISNPIGLLQAVDHAGKVLRRAALLRMEFMKAWHART